jgi:acyl carrier protein
LLDFLTLGGYDPLAMATPATQTKKAPERAGRDKALEILRDALTQQKLCDPSIDIEHLQRFAIEHPDESVVDSFAAAETISALDEVFGKALPKEILNHRSLTTLNGLRQSVSIIEKQRTREAAATNAG